MTKIITFSYTLRPGVIQISDKHFLKSEFSPLYSQSKEKFLVDSGQTGEGGEHEDGHAKEAMDRNVVGFQALSCTRYEVGAEAQYQLMYAM